MVTPALTPRVDGLEAALDAIMARLDALDSALGELSSVARLDTLDAHVAVEPGVPSYLQAFSVRVPSAPLNQALAAFVEALRTDMPTFRRFQAVAKQLQGRTRGPLMDILDAIREGGPTDAPETTQQTEAEAEAAPEVTHD